MDQYAHIRVLVSLILGLSITRILSGLSRRVQQPHRTDGMAAQIVWSLAVLVGAVHFWWWEFDLRRIDQWHFGTYVFVLAFAAQYFLMATLIFPDGASDHAATEQAFLRNRPWFCGIFVLSLAFDLFDTLIKGRAHLQMLGPEYPLRLVLGVALALAALRAGRPRGVTLAGLAWLFYDLSWILRRYDLLG